MSNSNQNNYSVEIDYNNDCVNYYDRSGNYITDGAQLLGKGTIAFFSDFKNTTIGEYSRIGGKLLFGVENGYKFAEYLTQQSAGTSINARDVFIASSQTAVRVAATDGASWLSSGTAATVALALMPATAGLSTLIIVPLIVGAGVKVTAGYFSGKEYDNSNTSNLVAEFAGILFDNIANESNDTIVGITGTDYLQSEFEVKIEDNSLKLQTSTPITPEQHQSILQSIAPLAKPSPALSYEIVAGDTLTDIAASNGTTIDALLELNPNITDPNLINVGDNLVLNPAVDAEVKTITLNDEEYVPYRGDVSEVNDSGILGDGEQVNITKVENQDGSTTSFVEKQKVVLSDGTPISSIELLNTGVEAKGALDEFMSTHIMQTVKKFFTDPETLSGWALDTARMLANGEEIDDIATYIFLKSAIEGTVEGLVFNQALQTLKLNNIKLNNTQIDLIRDSVAEGSIQSLSPELQDTLKGLLESAKFKFISGSIVTFVTSILMQGDDGLDGEEYAEIGMQAIAAEAVSVGLYQAFPGMNSSVGHGAAMAITYAITRSISDIFADDHMNSHQWNSMGNTAGAMFVSGVAGHAAGMAIASAASNAAVLGMLLGPLGSMVAVMVVMSLIGGKEYEDGEYPNPFDFLKFTEKDDGTGQTIYGLETDGVVARARDGYDDDIVGTSGADNLIGGDGTNQISGNDGNDYIEGRDSNDTISGGDGNDIIEAGAGDDYIFGGAGSDIIHAGSGADQIDSGEGNDIIYGDSGNDIIVAGIGNDVVYGGSGDDQISAGAGNDIAQGGLGSDIILGEAGDDKIYGGENNDSLYGGDGNDLIIAGSGADTVYGEADNDIIVGGAGIDMLYGDAGADLIAGGDNDDLIMGGIGNDQLGGGTGNDTILGEIGDDQIVGGSGNDDISGGSGFDIIMGGLGDDALDGGADSDFYVFNSGDGFDEITDESGDLDSLRFVNINSADLNLTKSANDLIITFTGNITDQITIKNSFIGDTLSCPIESLEFITLGTESGDSIDLTSVIYNSGTADFNYIVNNSVSESNDTSHELLLDSKGQLTALDNAFHNSEGYSLEATEDNYQDFDYEFYNEVEWRSFKKARGALGGHYTVWYKYYEKYLEGTANKDRLVGSWWDEIITGNESNDYLYGNDGNDIILANAGDDYIEAGAGNDEINAGDGNDVIEAGAGNDIIKSGAGNDKISTGTGNDKVTASSGNNIIIAEFGNNIIIADDGNNQIEAGDGNDQVTLGDGNNRIILADGTNQINAGNGNNTIVTGADADSITLGNGDNKIDSGAGNDNIIVGNGANFIYSGAGNDTITAETGNNEIYAGSGDDSVTVGNGDNQIYLGTGNDTLSVGSGNNVILAESGNNQITVQNITDITEITLTTTTSSSSKLSSLTIPISLTDDISTSYTSQITTGFGNDAISISSGNSIIDSGDGNDEIIVTDGDHNLKLGNGNNQITSGAGDLEIEIGNGDNIINLNGELINFDSNYYIENYSDLISGLNQAEDKTAHAFSHFQTIGKFNNYNPNKFLNLSALSEIIIANNTELAEAETAYDWLLNQEQSEIFNIMDNISTAAYSNQISQNKLNLGNGDNVIYADNSINEIEIGHGDNSINLGSNNDIINIGNGNNYINTGAGNDEINIGQGDNNINAGQGDDVITLSNGNNLFQYNSNDGNDIIHAVSGNQTIEFNDLNLDDITISKSNANLLITIKTTGAVITLNNFSESNYSFQFSDNSKITLDNLLIGSATNDNLIGSNARDQILADSGMDALIGFAGNDYLAGDAGNDVIFGGTDNDAILGGAGNDYLDAGAGDDILISGKGNDKLFGGSGNDKFLITKAPGAIDKITDFNLAEDSLDLTDFDRSFTDIKLLATNSSFNENGDLSIDLGANQTLILQGITADKINLNLAGLNIKFAIDAIAGTSGSSGNDIITGTNGDDEIIDGLGLDILSGGAGSDKFILTAEANATDIIKDFNVIDDVIELDGFNEINFNQLKTQNLNGDVIVEFANDQKLILRNINSNNISAEHFKFDVFNANDLSTRFTGQYSINEHSINEAENNIYQVNIPDAGYTDSNYNINNPFNNPLASARNYVIQNNIINSNYSFDQAGDFNGDGKMDFAKMINLGGNKVGIETRFADSDYHSYTTKIMHNVANQTNHGDQWKKLSGDFDGDGDTDLIRVSRRGGRLGDSHIDGYEFNHSDNFDANRWGVQGDHWNSQYWFAGDFNGDGIDDIGKAFYYNATAIDIHLSDGDNMQMKRWGLTSRQSWDAGDLRYTGRETTDKKFIIGDYNNDGRDDIASINGNIHVYSATEDKKFIPTKWSHDHGGYKFEHKWLSGDFTGDGIDDLVKIFNDGGMTSIDLHKSNGHNNFAQIRIATKFTNHNNSNNWYSYDDNNDGVTDIIGFGEGQAWMITNNFGNNEYFGSLNNDVLNGGEGNDRLDGGDGNDQLFGENGDDLIEGLNGDDFLNGGNGNDIIHGGDGNDQIIGGALDDLLLGDAGDDVLNGNSGNDSIFGGAGNDNLKGEGGNDVLSGEAGNDIINGGAGDDILDGGIGVNYLYGGDGNDYLTAAASNSGNMFSGDAGNDYIVAINGNNIIDGGSGSDKIEAGAGNDIIYGNSGFDHITSGAGNDIIYGGTNDDYINAGDGNDKIIAGTGNDEVFAGNGSDYIAGGAGDDILSGGIGNDIINGGIGNNNYIYNLGDGSDQVIFSQTAADPSSINKIIFGENITKENLAFEKNSNDLTISFNHAIGAIFIKDFFLNNTNKLIEFHNGEQLNLTNFSIYLEDQVSELTELDIPDNFNGFIENTNQTIWIKPVNDAPIAAAVALDVNEDNSIVIDLADYILDDENINADLFANLSLSKPMHGSAILNDQNQIIYTPDQNYFGSDEFSYNITDNEGLSATNKISLTVNNINDAPVVIDNIELITKEDSSIVIDPNDYGYDADGDELSITEIGEVNNGIAHIANGKIIYTPNQDYVGSEIFNFIVTDGEISLTKSVNLTITEENDVSIITNSITTVNEDSVAIIDILRDVTDSEGNDLNITTISSPFFGTAELINNKIIYIPDSDYHGEDFIIYTISDGESLISKKLDINITNINDAPIIETISSSVAEDQLLTIDVLKGSFDIDGDILTITEVSGAQNGITTILDNKIIYLANDDFNGSETLEYIITDGNGANITQSVDINVRPVNDAPESFAASFETEEETSFDINLSELISDADGEEFKRENIILGSALFGSLSFNASGTVKYNPNEDFYGSDSFEYSVKDGEGAISETATIAINVNNINDAPIIFNNLKDQSVRAGEKNHIKLPENLFIDSDNNNLDYSITLANGDLIPDWISFDSDKNLITTNPNESDIGKLDLTLIASDGEYNIEQNFSLAINEPLTVRENDKINIIEGGDTDDLISAETGMSDVIFAGDGDDNIVYNIDDIWEEGYYAENAYSGERVSLAGMIRSYDAFDGGNGDDTLYLTEGNDSIFIDDLISKNGTISGSRLFGIEVINALSGSDVIDLSSNIFTYGSVELNGSDGNDVLWSNDGNDSINAGGGNDNVHAGSGDDIINGGEGQDKLTGGAGSDIFDFTGLSESVKANADIITDFESGADFINLIDTGIDFQDLEISNDGSLTYLNDNNSDFSISFHGIIDLSETDFMLAG
jgi:Ca2+-binding RTX toxin-like protein